MFAIYNDGGMWEETFSTIENAMEFVEDHCSDWDFEDFKDFIIVELVPRKSVYIPPRKIVWQDAE